MDQTILSAASAATERLALALAINPDRQADCDYLEGYNKGYAHGAEWQKGQLKTHMQDVINTLENNVAKQLIENIVNILFS